MQLLEAVRYGIHPRSPRVTAPPAQFETADPLVSTVQTLQSQLRLGGLPQANVHSYEVRPPACCRRGGACPPACTLGGSVLSCLDALLQQHADVTHADVTHADVVTQHTC